MHKEEFQEILSMAINRLIDIPGFWFQIKEISWNRETSSLTGLEYTRIVVRLVTNDRSLLTGQFSPFEKGGLRGFHENFLLGYLYGHALALRGNDQWEEYFIEFDVEQTDVGVDYLHRWLTVDEALRCGIIGHESIFVYFAQKYLLKYVMMSGNVVSGPSVGMMEATARFLEKEPVSVFVDMFCGTGGLSKVALINGVQKIIAVDKHAEERIFFSNIGERRDRFSFHKEDCYEFQLPDHVDLIVLEPFYESAFEAACRILPKVIGKTKAVLFNTGSSNSKWWLEKIRLTIQAQGWQITEESLFGETIFLLRAGG